MFDTFSCFWGKKVCTWHTPLFLLIFGVHWVLLGMGSYAIRPRICSPNTLFTFCIFSKKSSLKSPTWVHLGTIFCINCDFCVKKWVPKTASKKVPLRIQIAFYLQATRLPERQPRVRTVQTRNSCWSSSWSTVWDFCWKKWTGLKIGVKHLLDCWIVANQTEWTVDFRKLRQV